MFDLEAKWLWLSMQSYGFKIISWVKAFETQPSNFTNLRTLSLRRRHKLLSHWNLRLRICPPTCHMEGCICICTSLKQNYIYIICICKKNQNCTCNAWPWNGKPWWTYFQARFQRQGWKKDTIHICYAMQNTYFILISPKTWESPKKSIETILKHSWLRRFWKPRLEHTIAMVCNTWKTKSFNKKMPNKFQD